MNPGTIQTETIIGKAGIDRTKRRNLQQPLIYCVFDILSSILKYWKNPRNEALSKQMNKASKVKSRNIISITTMYIGILIMKHSTIATPVLCGNLSSHMWFGCHSWSHLKQNWNPHGHFTWSHPFYFSIIFQQLRHFLWPSGSNPTSFLHYSHNLSINL